MDSKRPLTPEEIHQALAVEILDQDGTKTTLGDLIKGKKVILIFIRHFWCTNCQVYTYQFGKSIPPSSLPSGVEAYIIGCGSSAPIPTYIQNTQSPYPVYTCPSLDLHRIFDFTRTLKGPPSPSSSRADDQDRKTYLDGVGGGTKRTWLAIKQNLFTNPLHGSDKVRGPSDQNGGEVVFEQDGTCSYIHRMQNVVDHTELKDLAEIIGAEYVPLTEKQKAFPG
ncbi:uncharacterized protein I303_103801 [Kwoniella dejecticola CBS 10117]|uniref:Thioredoxin domain-containing protein n=1 Tax=Kwoniella dejecticola CBS 10117 TaxID=1296121 RepID=A0A1A6A7R9_9TREE|nr:uncharacterized protein I303_03820 [Kwoniella dejecticola CBS 10117]OBR86101.1 hypothetical protein I303_03820 [Kwoniella dejecticola CBS 10117]